MIKQTLFRLENKIAKQTKLLVIHTITSTAFAWVH